jgi:hypothetical protein
VSVGFWLIGVVTMLILFHIHLTEDLIIQL